MCDFVMELVDLKIKMNGRVVEVEALTTAAVGLVVVVNCEAASRPGFVSLTHVQSRNQVATFPSIRLALSCAAELADVLDWSQDEKPLLAKLRKKKVRRLKQCKAIIKHHDGS